MFSAEAYWDAVLSQDAGRLRAVLAPEAEIRWPCTGERFTAEQFVAVNCAYPGAWEGEIERKEEKGDLVVCAARIRSKDDGASFHAVSFLRHDGEKIVSLEEYWSDDGEPPQWRRNMTKE
jgi:hypothetical protein